MASALGKAMDKYLMSAQGEIDLFFMAQDQMARVGPGFMRSEARATRWDDMDQKKQRMELKEAMLSGDKDRIISAYAIMDQAREQSTMRDDDDDKDDKRLEKLFKKIEEQDKVNAAILEKLKKL